MGDVLTTPIQDIELQAVDALIRDRFPFLWFDRKIERQFEADVGDERCRRMVRLNYIGILIYHCFLFTDYRAVADVFTLNLIVHFFVVTPFIIALNCFIATRPAAWLREGTEMFGILFMMLMVAFVVHASRSSMRDAYQFTIVLFILFAAMMQRLRFWYLLVAGVSAQAIFSFDVAEILPFSMDRAILLNSIFAGIWLFSMIGSHGLEHEQRMGYLLRLRERIRNRELETISQQDSLTGIGNRRALDLALERVMSKGDEAPSTAVLLLDIDHFKAFNDVNGHQEGDLCLKRVAGLITGALRVGDQTAYRFGGEEFLILLRDTGTEEALVVAERVRRAVARARIPTSPRAVTFVTISVGVASGRVDRETTTALLIAEADTALYAAKRNGRDRIWSASSTAVPSRLETRERMAV